MVPSAQSQMEGVLDVLLKSVGHVPRPGSAPCLAQFSDEHHGLESRLLSEFPENSFFGGLAVVDTTGRYLRSGIDVDVIDDE